MSISILMIVPNRNDATSLYRATGPFAQLRRDHDLNLVFTDKVDESILDMVDMVFMQRPATESYKTVARMCKDNKTPLWVDFDDLLFDIPRDNPAYEGYMQPAVRAAIVEIIQCATVVTTSTQQLKMCFQPPKAVLNNRVYVIPNALHDKYLDLAQPYRHKPHVNWRGSNTHMKDLAEYAAELIDIAAERKNTTFTFVGYNPWFITDSMPPNNAIVTAPMGISDFFRFMSTTNPSVQVVPLAANMFNLCKSNIAWIEATLAGAVTVCPHWPEWVKPGAINYKSGDEFKAGIERVLDDPEHSRQLHELSWNYIRKNLILSQVNDQRMRIVNELFSLSRTGSCNLPPGGEPVEDKTPDTVMDLD